MEGWSSRRGPDLSSSHHETLTATSAKSGHTPTQTNFSVGWIVRDCNANGFDEMENLFLTTLLISVVIGVLIIYHVTPEG